MRLVLNPVLFAAAIATSLSAQSHDPVPCRISVESYGSVPEVPSPPRIGLDVSSGASRLVVSDGRPGDLALLVLGGDKADAGIDSFARLLVRTDIVVAGGFDSSGRLAMNVPLMTAEMVGRTFFAQGMSWNAEVALLMSSAGLEIDVVAGNPQADLDYNGPKQKCVLVRDHTRSGSPYSLSTRVSVPSDGYVLHFDHADNMSGMTTVYLTLEERAGGRQAPSEKSCFGVLPEVVGKAVEVRIREVRTDLAGKTSVVHPYRRGAMIRTEYTNRP